MKSALLVFVAFAMCTSAAQAEDCPDPSEIVLFPVKVVDVETGNIRRDRALVLAHGRIVDEIAAASVTARTAPEAARVDGHDAYVIPGLWDMHVHALWDSTVPAAFFRMFLENGVTSVRDMGGDLDVALATRTSIEACRLQAPHLWFAGPFLDGPQPVDPSLSIALHTPAEGRAAVKMLRRQGVDFIKVYTLVPSDVFSAVVDEATQQGLAVAGHLPQAVTATSADALRMASVEHLAIELGGLCPADNRGACRPVFDALLRARVAQTPTLIVREVSTRMAEANFPEPPSFDAVPEVVKSYWRQQARAAAARATVEWRASRATSLAHARWMTRELFHMKATILAGTDAGNPFVVPGASLHDELGLLVEAGLTPLAALRAATVVPARFMHRDDMGVIAPGSVADFVLLAANPLTNISNTRTVTDVYVGGKRVYGRLR